MANLALNVTIKWKIIITLLSIIAVATLLFYSSLWKQWRTYLAGATGNANVRWPDDSVCSVQTGYLTWENNDEAVFYRRIVAENSKFAVLLLHGARFTSKNWQDIGTLKVLSSKGYTAVAVDLPSYGVSSLQRPKDNNGKIQFLADLIKTLKLERPVLVAPSMSGSYAMPFVMNEDHSEELRGFIPVAPSSVGAFKEADLEKLKLRTLLVYGEKDAGFEPYVDKMKKIPGSEFFMIKNAGHPCYIDKPGEFHQKVLEFLGKLD